MLYSLGMTQEDICREYYNTVTYVKSDNNNWSCPFFPERLKGVKPTFDVIDADTGEVIAPADKKVTPRLVNKLLEQKKTINILVPSENFVLTLCSLSFSPSKNCIVPVGNSLLILCS